MKELKELIKISGLSEETIRLYEELELIKGHHVSDGSKHYGDHELLKLWRISLLKKAGYELNEIAKVIDSNENELHNMLAEQRIKVDREMARLSRIRGITTKAMQLNMMDAKFIKAISNEMPYTSVLDYLMKLQ